MQMSTNTEIIKNNDLQGLVDNKRKLVNEIREFEKSIKPIEFESYQDYFLIKTFKKGISASGHVDIDSLRNKEYGIYYKKIKKNSAQDVGVPIPSNPSSSSSSTRSSSSIDISDTEYSGDNNPVTAGDNATGRRRRTRSQVTQREKSVPISLPSIREAKTDDDDGAISEINSSELPFLFQFQRLTTSILLQILLKGMVSEEDHQEYRKETKDVRNLGWSLKKMKKATNMTWTKGRQKSRIFMKAWCPKFWSHVGDQIGFFLPRQDTRLRSK